MRHAVITTDSCGSRRLLAASEVGPEFICAQCGTPAQHVHEGWLAAHASHMLDTARGTHTCLEKLEVKETEREQSPRG